MQVEERRFAECGAQVETREDGTKQIVGYGAVFYRADDPGTEFMMRDGVAERISPKAFERSLSGKGDVVALFNHDRNYVLGRRSAGTLRLSVDERGLRYEITPPDVQYARDVMHLLERGDLGRSSFAFYARKVTWQEDRARKLDIRMVEDAELVDIGPVTVAAYAATSAGARAADESVERELTEWTEHKRHQAREALKIFEYRARAAAL